MSKRNDLLEITPTINWSGKPNRKYFLNYLIQKFDYDSMIEVGVRDGRTTFYLLDNNPNLKIRERIKIADNLFIHTNF